MVEKSKPSSSQDTCIFRTCFIFVDNGIKSSSGAGFCRTFLHRYRVARVGRPFVYHSRRHDLRDFMPVARHEVTMFTRPSMFSDAAPHGKGMRVRSESGGATRNRLSDFIDKTASSAACGLMVRYCGVPKIVLARFHVHLDWLRTRQANEFQLNNVPPNLEEELRPVRKDLTMDARLPHLPRSFSTSLYAGYFQFMQKISYTSLNPVCHRDPFCMA